MKYLLIALFTIAMMGAKAQQGTSANLTAPQIDSLRKDSVCKAVAGKRMDTLKVVATFSEFDKLVKKNVTVDEYEQKWLPAIQAYWSYLQGRLNDFYNEEKKKQK